MARGIFGVDRVYVAPRLDDAIDQAATLAEEGGVFGEAIGSGGVLVTGSVVTVGEARHLLDVARTRVNRSTAAVDVRRDAGAAGRRAVPDRRGHHRDDRHRRRRVALARAVGLAVLCVVAAGLLGRPGGYALGWAVQVARSRSAS